ncbi:uncharacterized protein LOC119456709 [Dermacentor silvarum]|uniref:uncharacterized protein LOC119456709 n=1 Tax=Dermacentor silvarum TaxID=543639 RepID=UPI002101559B|nr:uncharacterized protein LOC119456709 [Dermacentor silvarum]
MSGESLICTVSVARQDRIWIPRDGLCNFLFYDSLYRPQGDTLMKSPGPQLLKFLNAATISRETDHGCSVDIDNVRAFSDHLLEKTGKKRIKEMAKQKVIDYGFLTLDHSRSSVPSIEEALSALKDVTEIIKKVTGKTGVTVLGIYSKLKTSCQTISDIIGQEFKPSAIVILGHISYPDRHAHGCHILPPNLYGVPRDMLQKIGYGHLFGSDRRTELYLSILSINTLTFGGSSVMSQEISRLFFEWKDSKNTDIGLASQEDGVALGRCVEQKIEFTAKIPVKVSLTLKGRRYKAKPEGDPSYVGIRNFDLLRKCGRAKRDPKYEQDAPAVRVCGRSEEYKQHINFSEQYQSVVTYDKHKGYTITFDNDDSLRKKVCDARASHGSFSLAAYDVNYDQGKNSCPKWGAKGHYSRLNLVRQLNSFMRGENTSKGTQCDSDNDITR